MDNFETLIRYYRSFSFPFPFDTFVLEPTISFPWCLRIICFVNHQNKLDIIIIEIVDTRLFKSNGKIQDSTQDQSRQRVCVYVCVCVCVCRLLRIRDLVRKSKSVVSQSYQRFAFCYELLKSTCHSKYSHRSKQQQLFFSFFFWCFSGSNKSERECCIGLRLRLFLSDEKSNLSDFDQRIKDFQDYFGPSFFFLN